MQHHGAALRGLTDDEHAAAVAADWRSAGGSARLTAVLEYAEKLTLEPRAMRRADILALRDAGLDDEAILHTAEVVAYFNFVNRLADGLGVSLEDDWSQPIID